MITPKIGTGNLFSRVGSDQADAVLHATTTRLHYKTNLRNMLEHAGNRLCTQAQFEWREVFIKIHEAMRTQVRERWQWEVITDSRVMAPVCYKLGHCPFMATFDRQCTIRERVNQGRFDEIDVKEWLADPTAGRRD
jgi:thymidylate synthase ThyX